MDLTEDLVCHRCSKEVNDLVNHECFGWMCPDCIDEQDHLDRTFDWETWDEERRQRIAESNEY